MRKLIFTNHLSCFDAVALGVIDTQVFLRDNYWIYLFLIPVMVIKIWADETYNPEQVPVSKEGE